MSLKFKDEIDSTTFDNLTKEDVNVVFELPHMAFNITHEIVRDLEFFFVLLLTSMKKKTIILFSKCWVLSRLKTYHLVSSLIGHEQGKAIIEKYDRKYLSLCF